MAWKYMNYDKLIELRMRLAEGNRYSQKNLIPDVSDETLFSRPAKKKKRKKKNLNMKAKVEIEDVSDGKL